MKCPRCESTTLDERDRDGIVIDVCTSCRGLWLDRGELEKLIARATRDLDELAQHQGSAPVGPSAANPPPVGPPPRSAPPPPREHVYEQQRRHDSTPPRGVRYDDLRRREYDDRHHYPRRKKSWIESLGDIFD